MTKETFWQNFETIDNEQINQKLEKLNSFISKNLENKEVLKILNKIDSINQDKDIDMAYNTTEKKYYIIVDGKMNPHWLTFEELRERFSPWLSIKQIEELPKKNYEKYIKMDRKNFLTEIEKLNEIDLENLLTEIEELLIKLENSKEITKSNSTNRIKDLKHKAKDIRYLYYKKTGFPIPWNEKWIMITPYE